MVSHGISIPEAQSSRTGLRKHEASERRSNSRSLRRKTPLEQVSNDQNYDADHLEEGEVLVGPSSAPSLLDNVSSASREQDCQTPTVTVRSLYALQEKQSSDPLPPDPQTTVNGNAITEEQSHRVTHACELDALNSPEVFRWENELEPQHLFDSHDHGLGWLFDDDSRESSLLDDGNIPSFFNLDGQLTSFDDFWSHKASLPTGTSCPASAAEPGIEVDLAAMVSEPPGCHYKICHALTQRHRDQLLWSLRADFPDLCIADPLLSLNNLQHGLHLYFKHVSPEYSIFHSSLVTQSETKENAIQEWYGERPSWHLIWAMIILGWLCPSYTSEFTKHYEPMFWQKHIFSTPSPSLSLIQLLFLTLVFARYYGRSEEASGFAINIHGVLIDTVRRLDTRDDCVLASGEKTENLSTEMRWFNWMKVESLRRYIDTKFFLLSIVSFLDIKIDERLIWGELRFSPFELNFVPPCEDELWYAQSADEWHEIQQQANADDRRGDEDNYLRLLKHFWNHAPSYPFSNGAISTLDQDTTWTVAWDIRRQSNTNLSPFRLKARRRAGGNSSSSDWVPVELSSHVQKSFEEWISWWTSQTLTLSIKHVALTWRNCTCMFRLAHALYEVGSFDFQIISGRAMIEGRTIRASEYLASQRRFKQWVKQDNSLHAVLEASKVIRDRLRTEFSSTVHCHHCSWLLYLAGLLCWLYGFALRNGWQTSLTHPHGDKQGVSSRSDLGLVHAGFGTEACEAYLDAAIFGIQQKLGPNQDGSDGAHVDLASKLQYTHGVLITLADMLAKHTEGRRSWLIEDAIVNLRRLT
ncbi:hypothetical protein EDD36DRAFT_414611 [Exophiala viscosa]|uniref:Transcription factor domain-containing protein n=1 Tax=Exophiala viscosa TaxID=2486360 RepID=A0AAN6IJ01_9EURO|nr:hypothetical protein EDD36DRAFT_414611 [Exophiala viscosa]